MDRLAIFDLDGTLLDTVEDLSRACNFALETLGYPVHPLPEYKFLCGRGIRNLIKGALPEDLREDAEVISRSSGLFFSHYGKHMTDCTRPYDGIPLILSRIQDAGVHVAVASNKFQEGVEKLMDHFFPDIRFCAVLGQREGYPIKPDPMIVEEALGNCPGLTRGDVLYIGDSNVDMQTGINAGVRTAGVLWGFRSREELGQYNPWKLLERPSDLEDAILGEWD